MVISTLLRSACPRCSSRRYYNLSVRKMSILSRPRSRILKVLGCELYPKRQASIEYYNALEVSPKATQAEIKAAYYRLSKLYHPDSNKDSKVASEKFHAISEAYEVLGNFKLRKLYDKGLLHTVRATMVEPEEVEVRHKSFYQSRGKRGKVPTEGRVPGVYDFDEWSRLHYSSAFKRDQDVKKQGDFWKEKKAADNRGEGVSAIAFGILMFAMCVTVISNMYSRDVVVTPSERKSG